MYSAFYEDSNQITTRKIATLASGFLFSAAWWFIIDAAVYGDHAGYSKKINGAFVVPCIVASIALFMMNCFAWQDFMGGHYSDSAKTRARFCMFTSLVLLFGCIFGAIWIVVVFSQTKGAHMWPSIAVLLNVIFVTMASGILRAANAA